MRFLPDTNMMISWVARGNPVVTELIARHRPDIALSSIVLHELYFGAFNSQRVDRNLREIEGFGIPILPFDHNDARAAGEIRATLRRRGTPIGPYDVMPYDVMIAGQALARGLTLVTANTSEFGRVEGLRVEDWTA
ncbi:MAG: hypothetical protein B7Y45_10090 [Sphingomonas sp. 28-66-16]|nr:MAG: hypothetical protein B7Y45_10090 [Sphingomonas sp. 28-66-16]